MPQSQTNDTTAKHEIITGLGLGCILYQGVSWQKPIEGAICSDDDVTNDVILKGFSKILGG